MTLAKPYRDYTPKPPHNPKPAHVELPLSPAYYAEGVRYVSNVEQAETIRRLFDERPFNRVGFDFEFRYDRPPIEHRGKRIDFVRSVRPLLLALSPVESLDDGTERVYRVVIDVRDPDVVEVIEPIFRLPVPFVAHYAKVELYCLWQLGISEPPYLWDTFIVERCLRLGLDRAATSKMKDVGEEIEAKADADRRRAASLKLESVGERYGVTHGFAQAKRGLQLSFLDHGLANAFSDDQLAYAAEDAVVAAAVYPRQVVAAVGAGLLRHLETIEMPWVPVVAAMCWEGVRIDVDLIDRTFRAVPARVGVIEGELTKLGLDNYRSHPQKVEYFRRHGCLDAFRQGGNYTFNQEKLKDLTYLDPAVPLMLEAAKLSTIVREFDLTKQLVDDDGRVHADHKQLGGDSGRQSSAHPNLLGLPGIARPVVVAPAGRAIGEVDLSQIEVGITAAVYHDPDLLAMFNAGDVYCAMVKSFFADQLAEADLSLSDAEFKKKHKARRDVMKMCTLGIIYGMQVHGLALRLQIGETAARQKLDEFMAMFPVLRERLALEPKRAKRRTYARSGTNLCRRIALPAKGGVHQLNWTRNHPVQATAGSRFKAAGIRLYKLYPQYDARLIVPMHDAFVFECPQEHLQAVAELTRRVLVEAVQERYPELRPRAEVNIDCPTCWNKDGDGDSLERFVGEVEKTTMEVLG